MGNVLEEPPPSSPSVSPRPSSSPKSLSRRSLSTCLLLCIVPGCTRLPLVLARLKQALPAAQQQMQRCNCCKTKPPKNCLLESVRVRIGEDSCLPHFRAICFVTLLRNSQSSGLSRLSRLSAADRKRLSFDSAWFVSETNAQVVPAPGLLTGKREASGRHFLADRAAQAASTARSQCKSFDTVLPSAQSDLAICRTNRTLTVSQGWERRWGQ